MLTLTCTNNLHVPKVFKIMKWPQSNQPYNYFRNINYVCRRNMEYDKKLKKTNMDILPAKVRFTAKACRVSSKCLLGSAESK